MAGRGVPGALAVALLAVGPRAALRSPWAWVAVVALALVPVWGIGLWRLLRDPQLRTFRLFGVAYLLLAALFLVTGGKPYYLAGLYPVLLAAGTQPVLDWARRSSTALLAAATLGWPELVATVAGVHRSLPPGERERAVILTENYGEAGALQQARARLGLPPVFSGHNEFGEWGPAIRRRNADHLGRPGPGDAGRAVRQRDPRRANR